VHTLSIIWGTRALPSRTVETAKWYRQLLADIGASTAAVNAAGGGSA
jgi:hypothetical protein